MNDITITLTRRQVEAYEIAFEHHATDGDAENAALFAIVSGTRSTSRGTRITLTPAQACDLMSRYTLIAMGDDTDRDARVASNAVTKLRTAGAETITEYNTRTAAETAETAETTAAETGDTVEFELSQNMLTAYADSWEHHSADNSDDTRRTLSLMADAQAGRQRMDTGTAATIAENYSIAAASLTAENGDRHTIKNMHAAAVRINNAITRKNAA